MRPCNNQGFARGAVVGTFADGAWTFTPVDLRRQRCPQPLPRGAAIDPKNANHLVLGVNGFSRRFTEGPGAGVGHVFESIDAGTTWKDISGNLPDVPVNDVVVTPSGGCSPPPTSAWSTGRAEAAAGAKLGSNLPTTAVLDLQVGPDGNAVRRHARPRHLAHPGRGVCSAVGCRPGLRARSAARYRPGMPGETSAGRRR